MVDFFYVGIVQVEVSEECNCVFFVAGDDLLRIDVLEVIIKASFENLVGVFLPRFENGPRLEQLFGDLSYMSQDKSFRNGVVSESS